MTVFKRGDIYWTEFVFKGQRVRESASTDNLKLARAFEDKLRRDLQEQLLLGRTKEMTFGEATDHYTATVIKTKRLGPDGKMRSGTKDDLGRIKRFEEYFGVATPLSQVIAQAKIAAYRAHLITQMEPNSANRNLAILRAVLNAAFKAGGVARQPIVEAFKVNDERQVYLSATEERRVLKLCPPYLHNLVMFYLDTGARATEGVTLTWDRVKLVKGRRSSVTFTNTKNGKVRTVPLPKRTAAMLMSIKPKDTKKQPRVFLWTPPGGDKPIPFLEPRKSWNTVRTEAKLSHVHIHDLRHTYGAKMVGKGVPIYDLCKLMGHSSIRMTERYAHLDIARLELAVSALD